MPESTKPDATALVVPVLEAEALVGPWRQRFDPSCPLGVPAHITLLYPFVPPERLDEPLLAELRVFFSAQPAFAFQLDGPARERHLSYLSPQPAAPFVGLIEALVARWPEHPPYQGKYGPQPRPHLSIGYSEDGARPSLDDHAAIVADLGPRLPVAALARRVLLMIRRQDRWAQGPGFDLGPASPGAPIRPRRSSGAGT